MAASSSSSGVGMTPEEPLDYSVDKAADDAEKEFDGAKESIGSSAKNLKEKAGSELGESKQSFSSTVDDVKGEAGKATSSAEDIPNKVCGRSFVVFSNWQSGVRYNSFYNLHQWFTLCWYLVVKQKELKVKLFLEVLGDLQNPVWVCVLSTNVW